MAATYVKFFRGSPLAYQNAVKNSDTLYFISEPNANTGKLYLGEKLISQSDLTLDELINLEIDGVNKNDLLIFDEDKQKWVNKDLYSIINVFKGATTDTDGDVGLVPPPIAGQTEMFLRSDGTWAEVQGGEQYIKSVSNDFTVDVNGQLSLNQVSDLTTLLSGKVDKKTSLYQGVETEWTLLSPENLNKLNSLVIGEGGDLEISGKVAAANVEDLDAWIQQHRDTIPGLLSSTKETKIDSIAPIKSLKVEDFNLSDTGELSLANRVITNVSEDFNVENNTLVLSKEFLDKNLYLAEVGDLNRLDHSSTNSTIVDELNLVKERLVWQDLV